MAPHAIREVSVDIEIGQFFSRSVPRTRAGLAENRTSHPCAWRKQSKYDLAQAKFRLKKHANLDQGQNRHNTFDRLVLDLSTLSCDQAIQESNPLATLLGGILGNGSLLFRADL